MANLQVFKCLLMIAAISSGLADDPVQDSFMLKADNALVQPFRDMNICNSLRDFKLLPHPETCKVFLMCWQGQVWKRNCDGGQLFDIQTGLCGPAETVNCHVGGPEIPDQILECPVGFIGRLPHPDNCSRYFLCLNGRRSVGECLPLMHFDMERRRCVPRSSARCMNN